MGIISGSKNQEQKLISILQVVRSKLRDLRVADYAVSVTNTLSVAVEPN